MNRLPSCWQYYQGSLAAMAFQNQSGDEFYFSYTQLVAYRKNGKLVVIKNYWSSTTGKHINHITQGDKSSRLDEKEFVAEFNKDFGTDIWGI